MTKEDRVVVAAAGNAQAVVRALTGTGHRGKPNVAKAIAYARIKTDNVDIGVLVELRAATLAGLERLSCDYSFRRNLHQRLHPEPAL